MWAATPGAVDRVNDVPHRIDDHIGTLRVAARRRQPDNPHEVETRPRRVDGQGPDARLDPVDRTGHATAPPQHVAGVMIAVDVAGSRRRGICAIRDLEGPLPQPRLRRPRGRRGTGIDIAAVVPRGGPGDDSVYRVR